jgi:hypothetical protein
MQKSKEIDGKFFQRALGLPVLFDSHGAEIPRHQLTLKMGQKVELEGMWFKIVGAGNHSVTLEPCGPPIIGESNKR